MEGITIRRRTCFISNDAARVSFAVIGIFLILGSSATSVYIGMNETRNFKEKTSYDYSQHTEILLSVARSDFSQIINNAGVEALQYISSHPVIRPSSDFLTAEKANLYRLKQKIAEKITNFLLCNYQSNISQLGDLGLSVDFSKLSNHCFTVDDISIDSIPMTLQRTVTIPFFGPEIKQSFPTYYKVVCEIPITIFRYCNDKTEEIVSMNLSVTTVLTTRYLLMHHQIKSFEKSLNAVGPFWRTFTLLANIYSLARGYRHYQTGKPENVVDNTHLELLTNLILLFEEGLSFSGVDPESLIDTIIQLKKLFSSNPDIDQLSVSNSLSSDEWGISFSNFQQVDYTTEKKENSDFIHTINYSDILHSILWNVTSIKLIFEDEYGKRKIINYDVQNSENSLEDIIESYVDDGWQLKNSINQKKKRNQTTINRLQSIIKSVYSSTFYTQIDRTGPSRILYGNPHDYTIDNGSGQWIFHQAKLISKEGKPEKGMIFPGSTVYSEQYETIWKRSHDYSKRNIRQIANGTVESWEKYTTVDTKIEQNVVFSMILVNFGDNSIFPEQIKDVCYENEKFDDSNLNTVISQYKESYFDKYKNDFFTASNGIYHKKQVNEKTSLGLITKVFNELICIYEEASSLFEFDQINTIDCPNPKTLITKSIEDISQRFQQNTSIFLSKTEYVENNSFICTQKKSIFSAKKWFIETIGMELQRYEMKINQEIDEYLEEALNKAHIQNKDLFEESMDEDLISSFNRQIKIPISLPMTLQSIKNDNNMNWNESVLYAIDHKPGYCSCFNRENIDGKNEYFLGIRNECLFGSTGIPILPVSPTTPWLITINFWLIQLRGEYAMFSISDSHDETVFHPFFCHEPLEYVRRNEVIRADDGRILGWNERLSYAIDTIASSVVPSGGCMVGDTNGMLSEHHGKEIN